MRQNYVSSIDVCTLPMDLRVSLVLPCVVLRRTLVATRHLRRTCPRYPPLRATAVAHRFSQHFPLILTASIHHIVDFGFSVALNMLIRYCFSVGSSISIVFVKPYVRYSCVHLFLQR